MSLLTKLFGIKFQAAVNNKYFVSVIFVAIAGEKNLGTKPMGVLNIFW